MSPFKRVPLRSPGRSLGSYRNTKHEGDQGKEYRKTCDGNQQ